MPKILDVTPELKNKISEIVKNAHENVFTEYGIARLVSGLDKPEDMILDHTLDTEKLFLTFSIVDAEVIGKFKTLSIYSKGSGYMPCINCLNEIIKLFEMGNDLRDCDDITPDFKDIGVNIVKFCKNETN